MKLSLIALLVVASLGSYAQTIDDTKKSGTFKNEYGEGRNQLERIDLNVAEINKLWNEVKSLKSEIDALKSEVSRLKGSKQ